MEGPAKELEGGSPTRQGRAFHMPAPDEEGLPRRNSRSPPPVGLLTYTRSTLRGQPWKMASKAFRE
jgi:hypothetical protein